MKKHLLILLFAVAGIHAQESDFEKLMNQDWANLNKYRADNERIQKEFPETYVVLMGNSITENWATRDPEFFKRNNLIGRGISGQTTPQMLVRFTPDVIDLNPQAVVILAGTNDVAGNTGFSSVKMITDNIKAMAQLATTNDIKVILASVLPVYQYPWRPQVEPVEKVAEINSWIKNYAEENGHVYLDYFSAMADERQGLKDEYGEDGVHPIGKGYAVMEPLLLEAVDRALEGNND